MKKIIALMLAVLVFIGSCALISLRTANSNSDSYDDYGDNDEEAAKYYATFEYKDSYETETQAKHYSTTAYRSQSSQTSYYSTTSYQPQTKAYITHVALQGAVIVKQDGTENYVYCRKCESCGYIESNMKCNAYASPHATSSSGFYCPKCKKLQNIEIAHYSN
jgi:uncharacterized protein YxeA